MTAELRVWNGFCFVMNEVIFGPPTKNNLNTSDLHIRFKNKVKQMTGSTSAVLGPLGKTEAQKAQAISSE